MVKFNTFEVKFNMFGVKFVTWFDVKLATLETFDTKATVEVMLDKLVNFDTFMGKLVTFVLGLVTFKVKLVTFEVKLAAFMTFEVMLWTLATCNVNLLAFSLEFSVFCVTFVVGGSIFEVFTGDTEVLMGDLGDTDTVLVRGVVIAIVSCV